MSPARQLNHQSRDERLDMVKGISIILVVFGHAARGLFAAGLAPTSGVLWTINEKMVYFVHLPLFVFTTGLLMGRSADRQGSGQYLKRREWALLWPFLVWTVILGAFEVLLPSIRNAPRTWAEVATLWVPIGQLWYLPFLMIATLLIILIRPWVTAARMWAGLILTLVASLLMWGHDGTTILTRGMSLLIFLAAGAVIGAPRLMRWWDRLGFWGNLGAGGGSLVVAALLMTGTPIVPPTADRPWDGVLWGDVLGLLASSLAVIAVCCLIAALSCFRALPLGWLAFVGKHSMEIYLAHILVTAGMRIVLSRLGVESVGVHLVVATALGTVLPLLLVPLTRFFPWLFTPPKLGGQSTERPASIDTR
ncbi:MAG: acyltransferase [Propionibacteriaceae bacterium]|nr:acyltransferase [Propionibacteriaceae bacterium]